MRGAVDKVSGMLGTPITFYGRVVDQTGNAIPNAIIDYTTIDKFDATGSKYSGKSDDTGQFSISGIHGAVLTVAAHKTGYYNIHGKSDGSFAYGVGTDGTRKMPPTKTDPAVFVLQKMGETEALIQIGGRQFDVSKTGHPLLVDLPTGHTGTGQLEIQSWITDSTTRQFDWRYRLAIRGGGLVERNGQFNFEAPPDGYSDHIELAMAANAAEWSSDIRKSYFARLPTGQYARLSINFYPGDRNFVVLESYVNPTPGSRNLEFDPAKQVKVGKK